MASATVLRKDKYKLALWVNQGSKLRNGGRGFEGWGYNKISKNVPSKAPNTVAIKSHNSGARPCL